MKQNIMLFFVYVILNSFFSGCDDVPNSPGIIRSEYAYFTYNWNTQSVKVIENNGSKISYFSSSDQFLARNYNSHTLYVINSNSNDTQFIDNSFSLNVVLQTANSYPFNIIFHKDSISECESNIELYDHYKGTRDCIDLSLEGVPIKYINSIFGNNGSGYLYFTYTDLVQNYRRLNLVRYSLKDAESKVIFRDSSYSKLVALSEENKQVFYTKRTKNSEIFQYLYVYDWNQNERWVIDSTYDFTQYFGFWDKNNVLRIYGIFESEIVLKVYNPNSASTEIINTIYSNHHHYKGSIDLSPDRSKIAIGGEISKIIEVYDSNTGQLIRSVDINNIIEQYWQGYFHIRDQKRCYLLSLEQSLDNEEILVGLIFI